MPSEATLEILKGAYIAGVLLSFVVGVLIWQGDGTSWPWKRWALVYLVIFTFPVGTAIAVGWVVQKQVREAGKD